MTSTESPQTSEYALAAAHVVAEDDLRILSPGYIHVRDGIIKNIGEGRPPIRLRTFELPRHLIMPGLINCHTHIGDAVLKELNHGVPTGVNLLWQPDGLRHMRMGSMERDQRIAGIRRALLRALATGTVALADFREGGIEGVHEFRVAAQSLPIVCLTFARHSQFPLHSEQALSDNSVGLTPEQLEEITQSLEFADGFSPLWANDTTDIGLAQTAAAVRERGKLLATHAGETAQYRTLSIARTGASDVERIAAHLKPDFVVHMTAATDFELEAASLAGIPIVMCARTQAALGYGIPPFLRASHYGALVGLGTDNAMISSPDLLSELEFMSRSIKSVTGDPIGVSAVRLLAAATIDAARILKLDDRLGSLSVGKSATMLIVDMDSDNLVGSVNPIASIVDRATATDIQAILVEGNLVQGSLPPV